MIGNQFSRDKTIPAADLEKLLPTPHAPVSRGKTVSVASLAKLLCSSLGPALRLLLHPDTLRQWPRLLFWGNDPVVRFLLQASNTAIINRWLNKGTKVVFLSSFPRSGNTWMRFMLCDILLQLQGVETTTELPVHPDNLIVLFDGSSIIRRLNRCPHWAFEPPMAFVKSHKLFSRLEQIFPGAGRAGSGAQAGAAAPFGGWRVLYVYRRPEDALVSLFHFGFVDTYWRSRALGIDAFCRKVVSDWVENISSYLRAADNGSPVFFVSYEMLAEKPAIVLDDLLHWLGVQHDIQMVRRAVSNMQFANLQELEIQTNKTRNRTNGNALFFRRGRTGSGRSELQESTLREIHERTASLLNEANDRQMKQSSEPLAPATVAPNQSGAGAPPRNEEAREPKISPRTP
jgi:hypothetical protein